MKNICKVLTSTASVTQNEFVLIFPLAFHRVHTAYLLMKPRHIQKIVVITTRFEFKMPLSKLCTMHYAYIYAMHTRHTSDCGSFHYMEFFSEFDCMVFVYNYNWIRLHLTAVNQPYNCMQRKELSTNQWRID